MKPNVLSSAVILSALTATAALATEGLDDAPIYLDKTAITLDAGYMMDIDNLSVDHLTGASIGMSYIFNRSEKSAHSIGLSFGFYDGSESVQEAPIIKLDISDIPTGVLTNRNSYFPHQKFSQQIIPVILSYKYHRNLTDSFTTHIGARAGVYISKSTAKTTITGEEYSSVTSPNSPPNEVSTKIHDYGERTHTSFSPTIGLEIGLEYRFAKNWAWHIGASIDASFEMNREVACENEYAAFDAEVSKDTAVSATIRTGVSYQF